MVTAAVITCLLWGGFPRVRRERSTPLHLVFVLLLWRAAVASPHFKGEKAGAWRVEPPPWPPGRTALGRRCRRCVCALGQQPSRSQHRDTLPLSLRVPWFSSAYSEMGWISSTAHVPLPVGDPDSEAWDLGCRVGSRAFQDLQSWESQMGGPCRIPGGCERQFSDAAYVLVLGLTLCYSGFQLSQKPRYT